MTGSTMPSRPGEPMVVELSAEHEDLLGRIARSYAAAAPSDWLRIVVRQECSMEPQLRGRVAVREVVRAAPEGLVQEPYRPPRDLHFPTGTMLDTLAAASPTKTVVMHLVVDRDGSWSGRVEQDVPRVLAGVRDETSSTPVHQHLERHRQELEEMAARLR